MLKVCEKFVELVNGYVEILFLEKYLVMFFLEDNLGIIGCFVLVKKVLMV